MASPNSQLRIREGVVTPYKISEENLKQLREYLARGKDSHLVRKNTIKQMGGKECVICPDVATFTVTYDVTFDDGNTAKKLEYYCDSCVKKLYARAPVL